MRSSKLKFVIKPSTVPSREELEDLKRIMDMGVRAWSVKHDIGIMEYTSAEIDRILNSEC